MEISHNIISLFGLQIDLWIAIMTWIVMAILIIASWFATRHLSWIPKGMQNVLEIAVEYIENLVRSSMGEAGTKYTYFFGSLFLFILVANMLGLVPGFASPTRDLSVTACLAILWVVWMEYIGIRENGLKAHLKHYIEPMPPFIVVHLLDLFTRPLTLSMRLFANIFAGEVLLEKLTEIFHLIVPGVWIVMSIMIGTIQALIFTILTVSYTGISVSHEDN